MVRSGLCIVILLLFAGRSHAQERPQPFETLELRLGATQNVNSNFLHEFWAHGFGLEGGFTTPFYLGYAEMGGAVHRYRVNESAAVPGFDALLLYAGWGLDKAFSRLHLEGGVRIGNYRMSFDEQTFAGVRTESELALMGHGRLAVQVAGPVSIYAAGGYQKVYTYLRMNLWYASAGLSYRFQTPGWLETVLR